MFKKPLVANWGEIAIGIIRVAREAAIAPAAIYSAADRDAIRDRYADEAPQIGPAPPLASYLQLEKMIKLAVMSGRPLTTEFVTGLEVSV